MKSFKRHLIGQPSLSPDMALVETDEDVLGVGPDMQTTISFHYQRVVDGVCQPGTDVIDTFLSLTQRQLRRCRDLDGCDPIFQWAMRTRPMEDDSDTPIGPVSQNGVRQPSLRLEDHYAGGGALFNARLAAA